MSRDRDDPEDDGVASICTSCGTELVVGALRCRSCGARLLGASGSRIELCAEIDPDSGAAVLRSSVEDDEA